MALQILSCPLCITCVTFPLFFLLSTVVLITVRAERICLGKKFQTITRVSKAGTAAEATEECYLLCSHGLLSLLSYATQDHLLRSGTALRWLDLPINP